MSSVTSFVDLHDHANALLRSLTSKFDDRHGLGTMCPSIYDTAWVSLVSRTVAGKTGWVYPHSFDYILQAQGPDGSWQGDGSVADAVINTMACLLSLKRHESTPHVGDYDIASRAAKATAYLTNILQSWDVQATERIAFEMIVPSLMEDLEKDGMHFDFPDKELLLQLNKKKLAMVNFEVVYKHHTTVLHSLEAFIGKVDFDRLTHHVRNGNLMASPSSTAAYLMCASTWDEEAERYLNHVIDQCKSYGLGAVCNVWPTTVFEFSWSVCNLFESRFDPSKLDRACLDKIANVLHGALTAEQGIIGFAPNVGPDSDDTAKALTALRFLNKPYPMDALIETFELPTHFQCFQYERNPSLSANCNILLALLQAPDPTAYTSQIIKAATFIVNEWWSTEGIVEDKWHLSRYYPAMLAAQGLLRLLLLHGKGFFLTMPLEVLSVKLPVVLFGIMLRIMQSQCADGSWGVKGSREETAYAIVALANLASLPYVDLIREQIFEVISRGRQFLVASGALNDTRIKPADYIWVGKVGYGIEHVCNSYVVSALHIPVPLYESTAVSSGAPPISVDKVKNMTKFYTRLPMYKGVPTWKMIAWVIEGYLYLPELARVHHAVFNRDGMKEDPYFEYLPFSWTGPNNMEDTYASAQTIFDMIVISMVNFQVDEFFDIIVQQYGEGGLKSAKELVHSIMNDIEIGILPKALPEVAVEGVHSTTEHQSQEYQKIHARLAHFVNFVFTFPRIERASDNDKGQLRREMKIYLLAHIQQCEDNVRLQAQKYYDPYLTPPSSYLKWVRSTASDHLSSQYSFAFQTCLLGHARNHGGVREDFFPTAEIKYIAQDCSTHLSVICRIFNDYGSLTRDRKEKNLNAVLFPEFEGRAKNKTDAQLKEELYSICNYERKTLQVSFDELLRVAQKTVGEVRGKRIHEAVRLIYNASEMYTEMYELKDLSTWN